MPITIWRPSVTAFPTYTYAMAMKPLPVDKQIAVAVMIDQLQCSNAADIDAYTDDGEVVNMVNSTTWWNSQHAIVLHDSAANMDKQV